MRITLTDEDDVPDAIGRLRTVYHNLMNLDYDNKRTRANMVIDAAEIVKDKLPNEYFAEFYEIQNGQQMSDIQRKFIDELIEQIQEESR